MKTYIKILIACLVLFAACCISPAAADGPDRDMFIFDLINQYRAAPFDHAVSLGYDSAFLQEKGITPETVFPPYALDGELNNVAQEENFRASTAAPEVEPNPPVRARMIQTSSVFSFSHFMPMETAGHLFVENLFKNELDTGVFHYILSERYQYAGTSANPGVVPDTRMNAWFFTLVVGSQERTSEIQMLNLINQIRANPSLAQSFLDADFMEIIQQNPYIYYLPRLVFQPVFPNSLLHDWARTDMAEGTPADGVGSGVSEPVDLRQLYPGDFFQTATVAASWEDMSTARPVVDLFSALVYTELTTWPHGALVFSNRYKEAGVAIRTETLENTGIGILSIYAGNLQLVPEQTDAQDLVPHDAEFLQARIYGLLFLDHDDDLIYSPGEEAAQHTVSVYELGQQPVSVSEEDPAFVKKVVTDNAGHFSLSLTPGRQWVFESEKDGQIARRIVSIEKDQFVKIFFSPPNEFLDTSL